MSNYLYTIYDPETREPLFSGVKADCFTFLKKNKLSPHEYRIESGLPNKELRTTSYVKSKPEGFLKRIFKK